MDRIVVVILSLTILILGGIVGGAFYSQKNFSPRDQCVEHSLSLSMHIHPELKIFLDDQPVTIPTNIGISPSCMKAVHTHDETGKIHLEYPQAYNFKLADFFAVWGQPLSKTQLLDKTVDEGHTLTMTVDGQPNQEFSDLVLKDGQQIELRYQTKK